MTKSREKVSVDRETNSFPRTGKPRRRREVRFIPAPLDSRRYSASGSAWTLLHCFTSDHKSRVSDEKGRWRRRRRKRWRNRDGFSSHGFLFPSFFSPPFLNRTRRRYAKVKNLPIREPVSTRRKLVRPKMNVRICCSMTRANSMLYFAFSLQLREPVAPMALPFPTTIFRVRLSLPRFRNARLTLSSHSQ